MKSMRANGTIRVARFVKQDVADANSVKETDANERSIGISDIGGREAPIPSVTADPPQAAQTGDNVAVHFQEGETCLLYAGSGGWTAGDRLKSDADGAGVTVATTGTTIQQIGAEAESDCAAGSYGQVAIRHYSERPALS